MKDFWLVFFGVVFGGAVVLVAMYLLVRALYNKATSGLPQEGQSVWDWAWNRITGSA